MQRKRAPLWLLVPAMMATVIAVTWVFGHLLEEILTHAKPALLFSVALLGLVGFVASRA